ncbi:MAG: hypothetical protein HY558_08295 [Euryarchaeota archaeon]|nr:hypothetical protein [Euryarchaeota archaeon]
MAPDSPAPEKNIDKTGQMARLLGGALLAALGAMAVIGFTPLDPVLKDIPVLDSLLFGKMLDHPTAFYRMGGGTAILMGILAAVQGATGKCWVRAMGFQTPI